MAETEGRRRVVIAVTESSPVAELLQMALDAAQQTSAEVVAVFVDDERWQRVASLPFTREIPKLGGSPAAFTAQRAEQLFAEAAARVKAEIDRLAAESGQVISFETLMPADREQAQRLFGTGGHLCITSSALRRYPLYTELSRLELEIRFVDAADAD